MAYVEMRREGGRRCRRGRRENMEDGKKGSFHEGSRGVKRQRRM